MNKLSSIDSPSFSEIQKQQWLWIILAAALLSLFVIYWDGLKIMVKWWEREEYSHGYMIPLVAAFLFWQRINQSLAVVTKGSWVGLPLIAIGIISLIIGKLSLLQIFLQYGFLISLIGISFSFFGERFMRINWAAFAYLAFMIPLPSIIYSALSDKLQLISTEIGVAIIRLFGISVFQEGNIIDLGPMQLQVAEACSGLRYLFPLLSFGFLIGYLYRGPKWQRILLFLSAIPITVFMNSFRIGVIGVTVDRWGIEMAEGFLHDFEGWVVFMGCVGILFLEIMLFHALSHEKSRVLDKINLDIPTFNINCNPQPNTKSQTPFLVASIIIFLTTAWCLMQSERVEKTFDRKTFSSFPVQYKNWQGKQSPLDRLVLDKLALTDYFNADFLSVSDSVPINFYVAWYKSQSSAAAIHSPLACIPGAGWIFDSFSQINIPGVQHVSGMPLRVNRAIIRKGEISQLVYYWYDGRNRNLTNEYEGRWHIFWDLMLHSRSDGALIRVVTYLPDPSTVDQADRRLQLFLKDFYPLIPAYVP